MDAPERPPPQLRCAQCSTALDPETSELGGHGEILCRACRGAQAIDETIDEGAGQLAWETFWFGWLFMPWRAWGLWKSTRDNPEGRAILWQRMGRPWVVVVLLILAWTVTDCLYLE